MTVQGGHGWLLADPLRFGETISAVLRGTCELTGTSMRKPLTATLA